MFLQGGHWSWPPLATQRREPEHDPATPSSVTTLQALALQTPERRPAGCRSGRGTKSRSARSVVWTKCQRRARRAPTPAAGLPPPLEGERFQRSPALPAPVAPLHRTPAPKPSAAPGGFPCGPRRRRLSRPLRHRSPGQAPLAARGDPAPAPRHGGGGRPGLPAAASGAAIPGSTSRTAQAHARLRGPTGGFCLRR